MTDSMLGRWRSWYAGLEADTPQSYGDVTSYEEAAAFLADCETVADWGTGKGFFKTLRPDCIGVDGTETPFSDVVADLVDYHAETDGVLLRHVLEHNYEWAAILDNAVASAQYKLCAILFTPCGKTTKEIAFTPDLGVPDMSFALPDLTERMEGFAVNIDHLNTNTQYGEETIIRARCK